LKTFSAMATNMMITCATFHLNPSNRWWWWRWRQWWWK